jgi:hypothetical protein
VREVERQRLGQPPKRPSSAAAPSSAGATAAGADAPDRAPRGPPITPRMPSGAVVRLQCMTSSLLSRRFGRPRSCLPGSTRFRDSWIARRAARPAHQRQPARSRRFRHRWTASWTPSKPTTTSCAPATCHERSDRRVPRAQAQRGSTRCGCGRTRGSYRCASADEHSQAGEDAVIARAEAVAGRANRVLLAGPPPAPRPPPRVGRRAAAGAAPAYAVTAVSRGSLL